MSQGEANLDRPTGVERRHRYRFEIARSHLLGASAALALLALLLFLSGLAIGMLIRPQPNLGSHRLQSAVLPRPSESSPPRQVTPTSRVDEPPRSRYRLAGTTPERVEPASTTYTSPSTQDADRFQGWQENDLTTIVWRPREQLAAMGRESSGSEAEALPERAGVDAVDVDQAGVDAADTLGFGEDPVVAVADAVDEVYQPRTTSSLVHPPSRWRRSQPLAAAFLVAPEDGFVPVSDSDVDVEDAVESDDVESEDVEPADVDSEDAGSAPAEEDRGWQPTTSHWQDFFATLEEPQLPPSQPSDQIPADDLGVARALSTSSSEASKAPASTWTPPSEVSEIADAPPSTDAPPSVDASQTFADDEGWQPSSSLWQSFLEAPYDWTAEKLPPSPPRRARASGTQGVPYGDLIDRAAALHGIDAALIVAMVRVESSFDPRAVSHKGARGLMQVMPATAQRFGVDGEDLFDPDINLEVGLRYLSWLRDRFDGDTQRMLAAYNAGEAAVDTYDGVPPYDETRAYVQRIYGLMGWADSPSEP